MYLPRIFNTLLSLASLVKREYKNSQEIYLNAVARIEICGKTYSKNNEHLSRRFKNKIGNAIEYRSRVIC